MRSTTDIGGWAEEIAAEFLVEHGWTIMERNWRYKKLGEIDIIAMDADTSATGEATTVFVEVRHRTSTAYGSPEASIGPAKVGKLRRTATMYLTVARLHSKPCRFDVIAIDLVGGEVVLRHYKNAL